MITSQHNAITIIILAAGASTRMGQPKQLIKLNGYSLLEHAVLTAKNSKADQVIVVLGSESEKSMGAIEHLPVEIVVNDQWNEGMGSSLKKGLTACEEKFPETRATLIMVCDQPSITTHHLNNLIDTYSKTQKPIVASQYTSTFGVPAVFDHTLFQEILQLPDRQGAKNIVMKHQKNLLAVDLPGGEIDLDTPEDLLRYKKHIDNC